MRKRDPMKKYRSEIAAQDWARNRRLYYGCAKIGGMWYVGTVAQLNEIGVWDIRR